MVNPKTTVWGILLLVGSALILIANAIPPALHGDFAGAFAAFQTYWPAVIGAIGGLGLIGAKDGGA